MKLTPLGDSAITISLSREPDSDSAEILHRVWAVKKAIDKAEIPGVIETVSSFESVSAFIDPLVALAQGIPPAQVNDWFEKQLLTAASRAGKGRGLTKSEETEIPVCFDDEFAPDLADVAAENVVERFCGARYQVASVGFTAGFPYLLGLPPDLATPRKAVPRTIVPAGSVGIGGNQAGIYPADSPGGWNIIGRTALRLFDPENDPPSLLVAGDRVRFKRVSRAEFDSYRSAATHEP